MSMEYLSAKQAAQKWGMNIRLVQSHCKNGRIKGAKKFERSWMIPQNTPKPADGRRERRKPQNLSATPPMPLLQAAFAPGKAMDYIKSISEPNQKAIAMAEYHYFRGEAEKACKIVETYLVHPDMGLRLSACLIYGFANLSLGHINLAKQEFFIMKSHMESYCGGDIPESLRAYGVFMFTTAAVLLHLPLPDVPPMDDLIRLLPSGLRFFACYIMAHKAYLEGDYSRSLGIAQAALSISEHVYPISMIYMLLVMAMNYMSLKQADKGREHFLKAWKLAQRDDFIEPFGEHHGLLHGLIETCLKKDYPRDFKRIISITYSFSSGWRKVHNPDSGEAVADNLTTTEFTIAMLANRGWSNHEIGEHLAVSEQTVKNYITSIFQKLHITNRKQLMQHMLK